MSTQLFNNNNNKPSKIVINSTKISVDDTSAEIYEFVLDDNLDVIACGYVKSIAQSEIELINDYDNILSDDLFELNHVRVNPEIDNSAVLDKFKHELVNNGVNIKNPPEEILMAICYKPIGELQDIVRFYLKKNDNLNKSNKLVFLPHRAKLSIVK